MTVTFLTMVVVVVEDPALPDLPFPLVADVSAGINAEVVESDFPPLLAVVVVELIVVLANGAPVATSFPTLDDFVTFEAELVEA